VRVTALTDDHAFDQSQADLRARVAASLREFLVRQRHRLIAIDEAFVPVADAIEGFVLGGGKRLRPAFGYWGFRAAGGQDGEEIIVALSALEFVQASALMHDDVMDSSDTRRGEPAIHRRFAGLHRHHGWSGDPDAFGQAGAILLGDLCMVWSDELLNTCGLDARLVARARPVFDQMRTEVTAGQYLDMVTQVAGDTSVDRAGKVARYKSAKYTVERPLMFGAALADADGTVLKALSGYGLPLGEAFQLRDDVLGIFGDPAVTGKPAGDDLREGKRTYLVAAALEVASPAQAELITESLGDRGLDADRVDRLRTIIEGTGALARTERRIDELTETALSALHSVPLADEATGALVRLAGAATQRAR
jgi:geranylgeranyl diphosphate synthase, type I